jgi:hypothetical protein
MDADTVMIPGTHDVLDAAEKAAARLNLELSVGALDAIEQRVSRPLSDLDERTLLEHAAEIQENTHAFIEYVFETQLHGSPGIITIDHISNALSSYCQKHRNQLPFCR